MIAGHDGDDLSRRIKLHAGAEDNSGGEGVDPGVVVGA